MKLRKKYLGLAMASIGFEPESPVLTGSKTSVKIDVNTVEVEDFSAGFSDGAGNDFSEISFD